MLQREHIRNRKINLEEGIVCKVNLLGSGKEINRILGCEYKEESSLEIVAGEKVSLRKGLSH